MSEDSVRRILERTKSGRPDELAGALAELSGLGPEAAGPLAEALGDESVLVRWAAAAALGEIGDESVASRLAAALRDDSLAVRVRAAQSLAKLGSLDGVDVLIDALDSEEVMIGHPPELVSEYAEQVLRSASGDLDRVGAGKDAWREWWQRRRPSG